MNDPNDLLALVELHWPNLDADRAAIAVLEHLGCPERAIGILSPAVANRIERGRRRRERLAGTKRAGTSDVAQLPSRSNSFVPAAGLSYADLRGLAQQTFKLAGTGRTLTYGQATKDELRDQLRTLGSLRAQIGHTIERLEAILDVLVSTGSNTLNEHLSHVSGVA